MSASRGVDPVSVPSCDRRTRRVGYAHGVGRIHLSPPDVGEPEREALLRAFDSNWITPLGPEVNAFEAEICEFTGAEAAAALASGTAALHLSLLLAGVGAGDEVWVSTFTFVAPANAVRYVGADLRFIDSELDLLGRRELNLDTESVAHYLTGRAVLVTGAGGSIGSELCRQIHRYSPSSLVMLDRDESALQAVQISIEGQGLLDSRDLVICNIRDRKRLAEVFDEHRPDVVFHAAALKHLPLLEMHGEEGWKTNVWGTQNLLELATRTGVDRFVNVSTDKAADSTSVLGHTKRLAEQLTSFAGKHNDGTYLSVRFGNVLGSRGSVLPLFREQIERGGPVTVTDPEVTRFFMTIPEACGLVIQAGTLQEEDGRVLVLDMGEPVKIDDMARRLVAESDEDIEIIYTGLRPGEKLHEVLFSPDEVPSSSGHPLISAVNVPSMSPTEVRIVDPYRDEKLIDLRDSVDLSFSRYLGTASSS